MVGDESSMANLRIPNGMHARFGFGFSDNWLDIDNPPDGRIF
jgi:hypothetical protein